MLNLCTHGHVSMNNLVTILLLVTLNFLSTIGQHASAMFAMSIGNEEESSEGSLTWHHQFMGK